MCNATVAWGCALAQASSVCSRSSSTVSTVGRSTSSGARGNVERFRGSLSHRRRITSGRLSALDAILGDLHTLDALEAEEQLDQIHGGLDGDLLHDGAECFLHILTERHAFDRQAPQVDLDSLVGLEHAAHPTAFSSRRRNTSISFPVCRSPVRVATSSPCWYAARASAIRPARSSARPSPRCAAE